MTEPKTRKRRYPTAAALEAPPEASGSRQARVVPDEPQKPPTGFSEAFRQSLRLTLRHEGGYVNHPRDPGGATNLGISLRYAKTRGSLFDIDNDGDVDVDDIRLITPETAAPAYHDDFWASVKADTLPRGVDHAVFDAAVNSGPSRAIRWLQHAVGAKVDGVFGPATDRAVQHAVSRDGVIMVIDRVCTARLAYLRGLDWTTFGRGWQRRVEGVIQEGHKIALGMPL